DDLQGSPVLDPQRPRYLIMALLTLNSRALVRAGEPEKPNQVRRFRTGWQGRTSEELESRCVVVRTVGSNPTLSANLPTACFRLLLGLSRPVGNPGRNRKGHRVPLDLTASFVSGVPYWPARNSGGIAPIASSSPRA